MTALAGAAAAPTLRRVPVPIAEPRPALRVVRTQDDEVGPDQGVLVLDTPANTAELPVPRRARPDPDAVAAFCAAVPTPTTHLPDPRRWAGQFVQAAVEIAAGQRSASQLLRWTSLEVHTNLARQAHLAARRARLETAREGRVTRAVVRSVRTCSPSDGVVEASAVVSDRGRVRAVALRLEGLDGRWRVTALDIG